MPRPLRVMTLLALMFSLKNGKACPCEKSGAKAFEMNELDCEPRLSMDVGRGLAACQVTAKTVSSHRFAVMFSLHCAGRART